MARWTCGRWRSTSSVGKTLDELEWPSLEARKDQSSLLLFHKIHCGAVSSEKDNYMTPAHSAKTTRSSHSAQYCRFQTYSDALKNSPPNYSSFFFGGQYPDRRGVKSTPHLVKTTAKSVCLFFPLKISKFTLPDIMFKTERTSKYRKKEKKKERNRTVTLQDSSRNSFVEPPFHQGLFFFQSARSGPDYPRSINLFICPMVVMNRHLSLRLLTRLSPDYINESSRLFFQLGKAMYQ